MAPDVRSGWTRRRFLRIGAASVVATGLGGSGAVSAHNLPKGQFGSPAYKAALAARGGTKAVFQSANVDGAVVAGKNAEHLLLIQIKNWLNGFQFSYQNAAS